MTFDEFISKYNGKFLEVGGSAAAINQCVDLANGYIKEVLQQEPIFGTNAQDFPSKADKNVYDYILNTPTGVPKKGDIMIYKSADNIGHIDIFTDGNSNVFNAFSQNWPLKAPCHIISHTYTGTYTVLGWLRCKITPVNNSDPDMTNEEKIILEFIRVNKITEGQLREGYGYVKDGTVTNLSKEIESLKQSLKDMADRISILESENKANNELILDWQSKYSSANSSISKLQADVKTMSDEKNVWKNRYEAALQKTVDKYTPWELIKMAISQLKIKK